MKIISAILVLLSTCTLSAQNLLTGTVIGYTPSSDSSIDNAFDGSATTSYSASSQNGGWVGLDLGTPHVITKVGLCPSESSSVQYGLIEGANNANFSDALPLYMYKETPTAGEFTYSDISVTRAFRYVRYQGPHDSYSKVAGLEFYGIENEGEDSHFYSPTNLPTVSIYVEDLKEPADKVTQLASIISVISPDGNKLVQDSGTIRLRGNFSLDYDKKNYRIKFNKKKRLLNSPSKAKKWTLIPSYGDKTLMRNWLGFDISKRMDLPYTPFCVPVNLWLNGDYKGCFELCDQVEIQKGRIDIDEMDTQCVEGESLTGGYFIEIDSYAESEDSWFTSSKGNPVTIKSPDSEDILDVQRNYIIDHFNKMENELYNSNFDIDNGYQKYLDLTTFLKRHLHQEFTGNKDIYWSVFLYKPRGDDKMYACPVWDQDLALENDRRIYPTNSHTDWLYRSGGSCTGTMQEFVDILLSDTTAQHQMQAEWATLRCTQAIDENELTEIIDAFADSLDESQTMNFWRWPILNQKVHMNPVVFDNYIDGVEFMKQYLIGRITWMDNKLSCTSEDYELTISSAGWSTLYIPFVAYIPDGLTAYKVSGTNENQLELEEVSILEANKPYLVKGDPGLYTISGFKIPDWNAQKLGILTGSTKDMTAPDDCYVLQSLNGKTGFYKVMNGEAPTINGNKAYLTLASTSSNAPYRYYELDNDYDINDLNAIESERNWEGLVRIYRLDGTIVFEGLTDNPTLENELNNLSKGVYLITLNGKEYKKVVKQ